MNENNPELIWKVLITQRFCGTCKSNTPHYYGVEKSIHKEWLRYIRERLDGEVGKCPVYAVMCLPCGNWHPVYMSGVSKEVTHDYLKDLTLEPFEEGVRKGWYWWCDAANILERALDLDLYMGIEFSIGVTRTQDAADNFYLAMFRPTNVDITCMQLHELISPYE